MLNGGGGNRRWARIGGLRMIFILGEGGNCRWTHIGGARINIFFEGAGIAVGHTLGAHQTR